MTETRFKDRFLYYSNTEWQQKGVGILYDELLALPGGRTLLSEDALWALEYSNTPEARSEPAWPVAFDPSGTEEQGMVGPKKKAMMGKNDSYLLVNDRDEDMEAYDAFGKLLWKIPALARGQGSDTDWKSNSSDTPPGLYKLGAIYNDYAAYGPNPGYDGTLQSYGWISYDLEEQEGQEAVYGRAGIMLHGGGSACGWPGAWAPRQGLYPTLGCVRLYNIDLRDKVLPLYNKGTVWLGAWQEQR
jgi:hypothetical protein